MTLKRIARILTAVAVVAVAVFILCIIVRGSGEDEVLWRVFSVCMPVAGICFVGAAAAAVIDFIKRR